MRPENPSPNQVIVECVENFAGCDVVLYTKIGANIVKLNADHLADLAIESARGKAGAAAKDGISYLMKARRNGIKTPLLAGYRDAILSKTQAGDLMEARARIRKGLA